MPKLKTKKTVAKRFKITASGKILRQHSGTSHSRSKESAGRHHRKDRTVEVSRANRKRVKRMLPHK